MFPFTIHFLLIIVIARSVVKRSDAAIYLLSTYRHPSSHPPAEFSALRFTSCLSRPPHKPKLSPSPAPQSSAAAAASPTPVNRLPKGKNRIMIISTIGYSTLHPCSSNTFSRPQ